MASRELRLLKLEADAVRRELNEWRDRAHLPRVEEPVRSEAFSMVLSGEVEVLTSIPGMDEEEDGDGFDNEDDIPIRASSDGIGRPIPEEADDLNSMAIPTIKSAVNPFTHNALNHPGASQLAHILPRPSSISRPVIAQTIPNVSFENPAMTSLYDQQTQVPSQQYQMHFNVGQPETEKPAAWNSQILVNQQLQQQQLATQHGMYTPPATSHGPSPVSAGQPFTHQGYYQTLPRQQHPAQHIYGSPVDSEDGSSVGSAFDGGDRRNSMGGNTYGSPQGARGSYEVPGVMTSGIRMTADTGMWNRDGMESLANLTSASIAVGGGGNGGGFGMMM
jgi:hypothetical protein